MDPVLLLCAHGSTAAATHTATEDVAAAVAHALPATEVILTWVDVQQPGVRERCDQLAERPVVIVPLLVAAGFHVYTDLADAVAQRPHHVVTDALGPDPALSHLLRRRIQNLEAADDLGDTPSLVLVGAGSSDPRAVRAVRQQASDLAELVGRDVTTGFVSAAHPRAQEALAVVYAQGARRVTVVSFHIAQGFFHRQAARAVETAVSSAPPEYAVHGRITQPLLVAGEQVPSEVVDIILARWETGKALLERRQVIQTEDSEGR